MHFCVSAARLYGRVPVPRKTSLNWFMPALVNISVGSSRGTTLAEGTAVWPCFLTKKSRNCWRVSLGVSMRDSGLGEAGVLDDAEGQRVLVHLTLVRLDPGDDGHDGRVDHQGQGQGERDEAGDHRDGDADQVVDQDVELEVQGLLAVGVDELRLVLLDEPDDQRPHEGE